MQLLEPLRFRFTEPDDARTYGDRWYVYDELAIAQLPARRQAALEQQLGVPLLAMMAEFRRDSIMSRLAMTWVAIYLADPDTAGSFDAYEPMVMLLNFVPIPADQKVGVAMMPPLDPEGSTTSSSSPPAE